MTAPSFAQLAAIGRAVARSCAMQGIPVPSTPAGRRDLSIAAAAVPPAAGGGEISAARSTGRGTTTSTSNPCGGERGRRESVVLAAELTSAVAP